MLPMLIVNGEGHFFKQERTLKRMHQEEKEKQYKEEQTSSSSNVEVDGVNESNDEDIGHNESFKQHECVPEGKESFLFSETDPKDDQLGQNTTVQ